MILLLLFIYLLGSVLAYGKAMAMLYELEEQYIEVLKPEINSTDRIFLMFVGILSWWGLGILLCSRTGHSKYSFKWSIRSLVRQWNQQNT